MFGRQPRLSVDTILGILHEGRTADSEEFAQNTRDISQTAFELARRNLTERADRQAENNSKLRSYPVFQSGQEVLVYKPYHHTMTRMVPTQNCYHGEVHMSSARNYYQWCIEYDFRTTPEKCPSTSPT